MRTALGCLLNPYIRKSLTRWGFQPHAPTASAAAQTFSAAAFHFSQFYAGEGSQQAARRLIFGVVAAQVAGVLEGDDAVGEGLWFSTVGGRLRGWLGEFQCSFVQELGEILRVVVGQEGILSYKGWVVVFEDVVAVGGDGDYVANARISEDLRGAGGDLFEVGSVSDA